MDEEEGRPIQPVSALQYPSLVQDRDFTRWLEQSEDLIDKLNHDLRGEKSVGRKEWKKIAEPLLNDEGIHYIVSHIRSLMNKNTFLSNVSEARLLTICLFNANTIAKTLMLNSQEYGVHPNKYEHICGLVNNTMELSIRRSMNEGERLFLTKTEHVSRYVDSDPKPGGILNLFKR